MTKNAINASFPLDTSVGGTSTASFSNQYGTIVFDGTKLVTVSPGVLGTVFRSNGASLPSYQAAGGVQGAWTFIQTQSLTASSGAIFTGLSATYNIYMLTLDLTKSGTSAIWAQVSSNGGSTWVTGGYTGAGWSAALGSSTITNNSQTAEMIVALSTASPVTGSCYLTGLGWSTTPQLLSDVIFKEASGALWGFAAGQQGTGAAYDALKVFPSSGTISGTMTLYGLSK